MQLKPWILALAAMVALPAQADVFTKDETPNLSITDNSSAGVNSVLNIADTGLVAGLTVEVALSHTWIGDLILSLSHGSTTVVLMDRPGRVTAGVGDSSDLSFSFPILFDDATGVAAETMGAGCGIDGILGSTTGCTNTTFNPDGALSDFLGKAITGDWTLTISDNAGGDTGVLDYWRLNATLRDPGNGGGNGVPEPATLGLLGLGLVGLGLMRRRKV